MAIIITNIFVMGTMIVDIFYDNHSHDYTELHHSDLFYFIPY